MLPCAAKDARALFFGTRDRPQLKIAPTVSFVVNVTVQLFGPVAVMVPCCAQLDDHPPKAAPVFGAVTVTMDPTG
jgi:hypothetical protein